MSHAVDKELFARIEKRWNKVVRDRDIDLTLREILLRINAIDGIMSVWSCAGHTLQEQIKTSTESTEKQIKVLDMLIAKARVKHSRVKAELTTLGLPHG